MEVWTPNSLGHKGMDDDSVCAASERVLYVLPNYCMYVWMYPSCMLTSWIRTRLKRRLSRDVVPEPGM